MTKNESQEPIQEVLAFFGGTFDPIHKGHLYLANKALSELSLSKVGFVPAASPPHKANGVTDANHRLAMLSEAVKAEPRFFVDAREYNRQNTSWTIDTLKELRRQYGPSTSLIWLLGADSLQNISSWKHWEFFLDYAHIVVFPRKSQSWLKIENTGKIASWVAEHKGSKEDVTNTPCGKIVYLNVPLQDISSTQIRQMLVKGEDISYWVDKSTENYIHQHQLYR